MKTSDGISTKSLALDPLGVDQRDQHILETFNDDESNAACESALARVASNESWNCCTK